MTHQEYAALKVQAYTEYKEKLKAIDLIWKMAKGSSKETPTKKPLNFTVGKPVSHAPPVSPDQPENGNGHNKTALIRQVILSFSQPFTNKDIVKSLEKTHPQAHIDRGFVSGTLRYLNGKLIEKTGKGNPNTGFEYRLKAVQRPTLG